MGKLSLAKTASNTREWTMERIGEALGVSQRQISRDLEGLDAASKPARPKGGRPKGSGKGKGGDGQPRP